MGHASFFDWEGPMPQELLLEAQTVSLQYGASPALVSASMGLYEHEVVGIVGPSGSGKSSLLHCLSGILKPTGGSIRFKGKTLEAQTDEELSVLRRTEFGFVFQFGELVPELSLLENVALPLRFSSVSRKESETKARELLGELGLSALSQRRPSQVSGGEMQRAAIARGLVHEPSVIFADEPTGALDSSTGGRVLETMLQTTIARGASLVLVTHDASVAASADRLIEMCDGHILGDETMNTSVGIRS
jgi:putative ABC transport system ATP-binding protein